MDQSHLLVGTLTFSYIIKEASNMILRQNPGIPGITHPVLAANQTVYQNNSSSLLAQNIFKQFF